MRLVEISVLALRSEALAVCSACQAPTEVAPQGEDPVVTTGTSLGASEPGLNILDPEDQERVQSVRNEVQNLGSCSPACLRFVNELAERHGSLPEVVILQELVFSEPEDWQALLDRDSAKLQGYEAWRTARKWQRSNII